MEDYPYIVCLVSAKKGGGMNKVVTILENLKKKVNQTPAGQRRPRCYVVGSANSGKSSFLNKLITKSSSNP
jgi:ribosome biogenesis GTPase A